MAEDRLNAVVNIWANRSLRVKGLAVVLLPVLALIISVALLNQLDRQKTEAQEWVNRTQELRAQLQNMFIVLISAESEVRNFGLNGREEGILPFAMSEASIDAVFAKVRDLVKGNANEEARLGRLKDLVHQRLGGLKELRTCTTARLRRKRAGGPGSRAHDFRRLHRRKLSTPRAGPESLRT